MLSKVSEKKHYLENMILIVLYPFMTEYQAKIAAKNSKTHALFYF